MASNLLTFCYLIASVSFILGLKMLSNPASAKAGNRIAALGMAIAIVATIFLYKDGYGRHLGHHGWIGLAILIGSLVGVVAARKVKMTSMPEMVSFFNGTGGACAALISLVEINHFTYLYEHSDFAFARNRMNYFSPRGELLAILLGLIIGSISFAGSMIAWGKLAGKIKDFSFKGQHLLNIFFLLVILAVAIICYHSPQDFYIWLLIVSLIYGVLFVMPIGGADMPVVISVLNSFTGVAAACGGFLYDNKAMLTGGILVGAAGTLLTILMCKAMNRSLFNVLVGSFGGSTAAAAARKDQGTYKEISLSDAAMVMSYAHRILIVPGYGLAVAQAQHACHELEEILNGRGVEVQYAIHPVAGRMPGHMNVLLAEADVSYDKLLEMEQANSQFANTDVVLVLGANDVVNPAAKSDPASPIFGMPILEVELAKLVIVNKRSMKPGYAGIENDLFFQPKTSMLFGDAKSVLQQLISAVKEI